MVGKTMDDRTIVYMDFVVDAPNKKQILSCFSFVESRPFEKKPLPDGILGCSW